MWIHDLPTVSSAQMVFYLVRLLTTSCKGNFLLYPNTPGLFVTPRLTHYCYPTHPLYAVGIILCLAGQASHSRAPTPASWCRLLWRMSTHKNSEGLTQSGQDEVHQWIKYNGRLLLDFSRQAMRAGLMWGLKGEVGVNWNRKSDSTAVMSSEGDCKERMPGPANSQARHLFSDSVLSLSTHRPAEMAGQPLRLHAINSRLALFD